MHFLPYVETEALTLPPRDGRIFGCISYCTKKANLDKCKRFIETAKKASGFHVCPYGFTCHTRLRGDKVLLNCSMRVEGYFTPKKANSKIQRHDPPVISRELVIACVNQTAEIESLQEETDERRQISLTRSR